MLNMSAAVEIKHAIVTQHVQGCRQDLLMQRIELADIHHPVNNKVLYQGETQFIRSQAKVSTLIYC